RSTERAFLPPSRNRCCERTWLTIQATAAPRSAPRNSARRDAPLLTRTASREERGSSRLRGTSFRRCERLHGSRLKPLSTKCPVASKHSSPAANQPRGRNGLPVFVAQKTPGALNRGAVQA